MMHGALILFIKNFTFTNAHQRGKHVLNMSQHIFLLKKKICLKNVVWHTFASALSIKFVFTFSPKITFFSTTFFLCNEKFEMLLVEWNRNNHSKEQATNILIRNFFIWNMFSLFPANGNIFIWAIYNEWVRCFEI